AGPARLRVLGSGPEVLDPPDLRHPRAASRGEAGDVGSLERIVAPQQIAVRYNEAAGVQPDDEQGERRERDRRSSYAQGAFSSPSVRYSPVLPNPPPPRSLGGNSATSTNATRSTR